MNTENFGPVPCPTCGQANDDPCVRGRKPRTLAFIGNIGWGSEFGAVWQQGKVFEPGHDSRRSVNK